MCVKIIMQCYIKYAVYMHNELFISRECHTKPVYSCTEAKNKKRYSGRLFVYHGFGFSISQIKYTTH